MSYFVSTEVDWTWLLNADTNLSALQLIIFEKFSKGEVPPKYADEISRATWYWVRLKTQGYVNLAWCLARRSNIIRPIQCSEVKKNQQVVNFVVCHIHKTYKFTLQCLKFSYFKTLKSLFTRAQQLLRWATVPEQSGPKSVGLLWPFLSPGPSPTSVPSGILIHQTVWPQYTNVTDRANRQDRQRSDRIGRTVFQKFQVTDFYTGRVWLHCDPSLIA